MNHLIRLANQLEHARERYAEFHERHDEPLEPGTPEFEEARLLFMEIEELLEQLAAAQPETAEGARAMTGAILAHSGDMRPSVCRMVEHIYRYLGGEPSSH